jgi:hypothetical protein
MLESFERTTSGQAHLVFRTDIDDVPTNDLLAGHPKFVAQRLGYANLPTMYNELYARSSGDLLMCGNDDMVFHTFGWDHHILEAANQYPDGVFDFGVHTHNEANFPFATVSRMACDRLGFFFDPRTFWGDIFWRDVTSHFGRAIMLPHVHIDHDWVGFNPDQIFLDGEGARRSNHMQYHGQAVAEAVNKLRSAA